MEEASRRLGRLIERQVCIMDLKGLSMKPDLVALGVFRRVTQIDQSYYPERLSRFFLVRCFFCFPFCAPALCPLLQINASWFFRSFWAIISPCTLWVLLLWT